MVKKAKTEKTEKTEKTTEESKAIAEMFLNAETAPMPKKNKTSAENREVIQLENLKVIAAAQRVMDAMESILKSEKALAKVTCMEHFLNVLVSTKQKPVTVNAEQDDATAQIVFSASAFAKPETADIMDQYEVPFEKRETIPARFVINPEIYDNQELLGKLAVTLKNLEGFEGIQIIQRQNSVWKIGVTDETFAATAKIADPAVRDKIFQDIAGMQFKKPMFDESNSLQAAVSFLQKEGLVNLEEKAKVEEKEKAKKSK